MESSATDRMNARSRPSRAYDESMARSQCGCTVVAFWWSGRPRHAATNSTAASTAITTKLACQPRRTCNCPPMMVASGGHRPMAMPT
ncbi:hypothetical protein D3C72_2237660 [compost metagenome]